MTAANANVGLDVTLGERAGYTAVTFAPNTPNPNNYTYSYKYSGGNDGNGNVTESGRGAVDIFVTLSSDPRYQIAEVGFAATNTQLSSTPVSYTHLRANETS